VREHNVQDVFTLHLFDKDPRERRRSCRIPPEVPQMKNGYLAVVVEKRMSAVF